MKKTTNLISIGIPVFNGEKTITKALTSLLTQTYTNIEIIVSDNWSSDNTLNKIRGFNDSRIKLYEQRENIGGPDNYKFVFSKAKGKFFMWHAADDFIFDITYLENLHASLILGFDFALPEFVIKEIDTDKQEKVYGKILSRDCSKLDLLRSARHSALQFYSLYRVEKLSPLLKYLWECKHFSSFWEGLFINVVAIELNGVFVSNSQFCYIKNPEGWSSSKPAYVLLPSFIAYSYRTLSLFLKSDKLKLIEKFNISLLFFFQHLTTTIYLIGAALKQKIYNR